MISSMRPMLLLQEDSFIPWLWRLLECRLLLPETHLRTLPEGPQQDTGCHLRKLLEIWFSNFLFAYENIMQRLSFATGLSIQRWKKLFDCFVCVFFYIIILIILISLPWQLWKWSDIPFKHYEGVEFHVCYVCVHVKFCEWLDVSLKHYQGVTFCA